MPFHDQSYSDGRGEWNVPDIWRYVQRAGSPLVAVPLAALVRNLEPTNWETGEERPGDPAFVARAMRADLSYPLMVAIYPDGWFICDGVHRLWKARAMRLPRVLAYVIRAGDLSAVPVRTGEGGRRHWL